MPRTLPGSPVRKSSRPVRDTSRDWEWINQHADEYRGQWVMVKNGNLLASAPGVRTLLSNVLEAEQGDSVLTYIPTVEEAQRAYL